MTRGIQLQQLSTSDLGHLGIPPDLLEDPDLIDPQCDDDALLADRSSGGLRFTLADSGDDLPDPLALAREVRAGLEEALALLIEALPAEHRDPTRHPALRAD